MLLGMVCCRPLLGFSLDNRPPGPLFSWQSPLHHSRGAEIEEPQAVGGAQAAQNQAFQGGSVAATLLRSWSPCAHITDCAL